MFSCLWGVIPRMNTRRPSCRGLCWIGLVGAVHAYCRRLQLDFAAVGGHARLGVEGWQDVGALAGGAPTCHPTQGLPIGWIMWGLSV